MLCCFFAVGQGVHDFFCWRCLWYTFDRLGAGKLAKTIRDRQSTVRKLSFKPSRSGSMSNCTSALRSHAFPCVVFEDDRELDKRARHRRTADLLRRTYCCCDARPCVWYQGWFGFSRHNFQFLFYGPILHRSLQCFDAVWVTGRASGLWKKWVLVCWWWHFDWRFARLIAPVVTTTSISNKIQNGNILVPANQVHLYGCENREIITDHSTLDPASCRSPRGLLRNARFFLRQMLFLSLNQWGQCAEWVYFP